MNIAFLGFGQVGAPLADHLQRRGHAVVLAARDPGSDKARQAAARNPGLVFASPAAAVADAEVVFLATPFAAAAAAVQAVAAELRGKILVDCTNPVGPGLTHGLGSARSGSESIQALVPETRVIKAFSVYGYENFEDNAFPGAAVPPAMFFCGGDDGAKRTVAGLIASLGWEPVDAGGLEQALHLEHMTLLWIRMVRAGGHSPHLVWARLRR